MIYLLDTHAFIWATLDTARLSGDVKEIIANRDNEIFVSTVTFWEIALKQASKKLRLRKWI
jgi:PIN domain nuclease of toxin-antitoxin system